MAKFEIDVSGHDLFKEGYTVCIAEKDKEKDSIIRGFKFGGNLLKTLISNWENNEYKYPFQENRRGLFKVRVYCIILFYLFKSLQIKEELSLTICRDFSGHENDVTTNLKFFLKNKLSSYRKIT